MKHGNSFAIGILALALAACGGSGGSSKSTAGTLTDTPRIEAVISNPALDPGYLYVDPMSIQTGDNITFQLVNYTGTDGSKVRNVLSSDSFRTSDTNGAAGTLSVSDGVFQASSTDTGSQKYILTSRYQGQDYVAYYLINPRQILLRGKIVNEETGAGVAGATIDFYGPRNPLDSSSQPVVIATVKSAYDGTYRVSIPAFNDNVTTSDEALAAPVVSFTVRASNLPSGYFSSYIYEGLRYDAGSTLCRPTLLSRDTASDDSSVFLPYKRGDRYQVDSTNDDAFSNGTIVLTPTSLYETKPGSDGCSLG